MLFFKIAAGLVPVVEGLVPALPPETFLNFEITRQPPPRRALCQYTGC